MASTLGQIGPKWDKCGTFYDQFQYILADLKKSHNCLIWSQSDYLTQFGAGLTSLVQVVILVAADSEKR